MELLNFSTEVFIIGVNPYVLLPGDILLALFAQAKKNKGPVPVKGTINGKEFTQTLVKYQGAWRLYINGIMRKAAGIDVGNRAHVKIMIDALSREVSMHPKFQKALKKNKKAQEAFGKYPPSRQKEINRYLNTVKTDGTLTKNIDRIVRHLAGEKVGYFVLLRNKKENSYEQEAFDQLSYYTLSHKQETFIHQYIVDAFSAQTANENTKSIKIAFALIGLYLHVEKNYSGKMVQRAHMQLAKYKDKLPAFALPENRGDITVFGVLNSPEGEERDIKIEEWMQSVWDAYVSSHTIVAAFLEKYLI